MPTSTKMDSCPGSPLDRASHFLVPWRSLLIQIQVSLLILTWSQDEYSNRRIAPASRNSDKVAGLNMSVGELLQQIRLSVMVSDIYEEIYQP